MRLAALVPVLLFALVQTPTLVPDPPKECSDCADWNRDTAPSQLFGNTYSVGTAGLSALLVTSPAGHVLLDGALPQSAPLIDRHIRALGFKTTDVKLILVSHGHYDHAGGVAALARFTGARVAASPSTAAALGRGENTADDPQFGFGRKDNEFPAWATVQELTDGEVLRVGDIAITAHFIPGHAPGSTAYTWRSCEGAVCKDMVYADSLSAVAAPGFRFSGGGDYPSRVDAFRRSITRVAELPCDILVAPHPFAAVGKTCRTYAADAMTRLEQRVAEEAKGR